LSYPALARTDDEAVAGGFDDCSRDDMKVIYAENSLDLSEEPSQEPEVSAGQFDSLQRPQARDFPTTVLSMIWFVRFPAAF
jgi:hypothetical protein